jgi:hypothetical protein
MAPVANIVATPPAHTAPSNKKRLEIRTDHVLLMFVMVSFLVLISNRGSPDDSGFDVNIRVPSAFLQDNDEAANIRAQKKNPALGGGGLRAGVSDFETKNSCRDRWHSDQPAIWSFGTKKDLRRSYAVPISAGFS